LLTGQELSAQQALDWASSTRFSLRPAAPRARELAAMILEKPPMVVRLTRQILVQDVKKRMLDEVGTASPLRTLPRPSSPGEA